MENKEREFLQEVDKELSGQIKQSIKSKIEWGLNRTKPFGYNNDTEKEIVQFIFQQYNNYIENPPKKLVDYIIESYKDNEKTITYEEAKKEVSSDAIKQVIACEVQAKWGDYFDKNFKIVWESVEENMTGEHKPIIDENTWKKVVHYRRTKRKE